MTIRSIDAATLNQWLKSDEALLIDVREPAEHAAEHIAGATLLPLSQIATQPLPEASGRTVVIHCLKGGRGQTACQALLNRHPDLTFYNLEGGIEAWRGAGLPTRLAEGRKPLPLDRQTQLTIGAGILISLLLAHLVHSGFLLLTAVFGAGLTIAGLTGFCGLAKVMALMPWNQVKPATASQ